MNFPELSRVVSGVDKKKDCRLNTETARGDAQVNGLLVIAHDVSGEGTCPNFREGGTLLDPGAGHFKCALILDLSEMCRNYRTRITEEVLADSDIANSGCPVKAFVEQKYAEQRRANAATALKRAEDYRNMMRRTSRQK